MTPEASTTARTMPVVTQSSRVRAETPNRGAAWARVAASLDSTSRRSTRPSALGVPRGGRGGLAGEGRCGIGRFARFLRLTAFFDFFASLPNFLPVSFFFREVAEVAAGAEAAAGETIEAGRRGLRSGRVLLGTRFF